MAGPRTRGSGQRLAGGNLAGGGELPVMAFFGLSGFLLVDSRRRLSTPGIPAPSGAPDPARVLGLHRARLGGRRMVLRSGGHASVARRRRIRMVWIRRHASRQRERIAMDAGARTHLLPGPGALPGEIPPIWRRARHRVHRPRARGQRQVRLVHVRPHHLERRRRVRDRHGPESRSRSVSACTEPSSASH